MDEQMYIATYSNIDVYECLINNVPLMRRCSDDWVNATQILKCANFQKAQRTRILEREVQIGVHEKIQGGYGRFQGTWVPLDIARSLADQYGITAEQAPILGYEKDDANPVPRKNNKKIVSSSTTPIKKPRKYLKKSLKETTTPTRLKKKNSIQNVQQVQQIQRQVQQQVQQQAQKSFQQQQQVHQVQQQAVVQQYQSNQLFPSVMPNQQLRPQQEFLSVMPAIQSFPSQFPGYQYQYNMNQLNQMSMPNQTQYYQTQFQQAQLLQQQVQQQKRQQQSLPPQYKFNPNSITHSTLAAVTSNENWSSQDDGSGSQGTHHDTDLHNSDTSMSSNEDIKSIRDNYGARLLEYFSKDESPIPDFISRPPKDFDINMAIDDEGHTPLHWASSIGNIDLIEILIKNGANPLISNNFGLNCLSKLISFNNSYELKNFPQILNLLSNCLVNTDINGRTPLHYLCQFSKIKSKNESLLYYSNLILSKLSSMSLDEHSSTNPTAGSGDELLRTVLNHQDINGDTALHLAIKSKNESIIKTLLDYKANDELVNLSNESSKTLMDSIDFKGLKIHSTPVQNHKVNTPDTQLTIDDNKENIFLDSNSISHSASNSIRKFNKIDEIDEIDETEGVLPPVPNLPIKEVSPIISSMLNSLADAYDIELNEKELEYDNNEKTLTTLNRDNIQTLNKISMMINSDGTNEDLTRQITTLNESFAVKDMKLFKVLERSQAFQLAKLIGIEENQSSNEFATKETTLKLSKELTYLQINRRKLINEIKFKLINHNISEKMNNYRKLISLSCGLKIEDIDELLDGLESALLEKN